MKMPIVVSCHRSEARAIEGYRKAVRQGLVNVQIKYQAASFPCQERWLVLADEPRFDSP